MSLTNIFNKHNTLLLNWLFFHQNLQSIAQILAQKIEWKRQEAKLDCSRVIGLLFFQCYHPWRELRFRFFFCFGLQIGFSSTHSLSISSLSSDPLSDEGFDEVDGCISICGTCCLFLQSFSGALLKKANIFLDRMISCLFTHLERNHKLIVS